MGIIVVDISRWSDKEGVVQVDCRTSEDMIWTSDSQVLYLSGHVHRSVCSVSRRGEKHMRLEGVNRIILMVNDRNVAIRRLSS
jgi:hypothetical protein